MNLQKDIVRQAFVLVLFFVLHTSCAQESSEKIIKAPSSPESLESNHKNSSDAESKKDPDPLKSQIQSVKDQFLNPSDAKAIWSKPGLFFNATPLLGGIKVPTLSFSLEKANFVQVLRCSHKYPVSEFPSISKGNESFAEKNLSKWAWQSALGNTRFCRVVGSSVFHKVLPDAAADDGKFYYVINPCVSQDFSATGKEECSYRLILSEVVEYSSPLPEMIRSSSEKINQLESQLDAGLNRLIFFAKKIHYKKDSCENNYNDAQAKKRFWKGVTTLSVMTATGVAGSLMLNPGLGMVLSQMAGGAITMVYDVATYEKPLNCPEVLSMIDQGEVVTKKLSFILQQLKVLRAKMLDFSTGVANADKAILRDNVGRELLPEDPTVAAQIQEMKNQQQLDQGSTAENNE